MFDNDHYLVSANWPPSSALHDSVQSRLRRKSAIGWNFIPAFASAYPSPPMSNPPSPTRHLPDPPFSSSTSVQQFQPPTTTTATTTSGLVPIQGRLTAYPTTFGASPFTHQTVQPHSRAPPPFTYTPTGATTGYGTESAVGTQHSAPNVGESDSPGLRGGRKSKAHVASACVNCKRAHLSCDVQRPCARCVAAGKQVSLLCSAQLTQSFITDH